MPSSSPDLRSNLGVLLRYWWLVALVIAATVGASIIVTSLQTPVYRASMKIVVGQNNSLIQAQFGNSIDPFTATMSNLLKSNVVADTVIENLRLQMTPGKLLSKIGVSSTPNSSVLEVRYDSTTKSLAQVVLRQVGVVFTALVKEKLAASGGGTTPITATVFDNAHLEPKAVSPRPVRSVVLAGILGVGLGLILAFAAGSLDDRLRTRSDAEEWFGAAVIGTLPKGFRGRKSVGIVQGNNADDERLLDALHLLRANFEFSRLLSGQTFLVTSAHPEEGKSTVTANLGVALAASGKDVICIEADLRRPRLLHYLNISATTGVGFSDIIEGRTNLRDALRDVPLPSRQSLVRLASARRLEDPRNPDSKTHQGRLRVVSSGSSQLDPSDLLTGEQVAAIVEQLRPMADYVLFDAPPILLVGDAFPLVRHTDGVILVARAESTNKQSAEAVRSTLQALSVEDVGIVLTDWTESDGYSYNSSYGSNGAAPLKQEPPSALPNSSATQGSR